MSFRKVEKALIALHGQRKIISSMNCCCVKVKLVYFYLTILVALNHLPVYIMFYVVI